MVITSFAPRSTTWCAASGCQLCRLQGEPIHLAEVELLHISCKSVLWTSLPSVADGRAPAPPAFSLMKLLPQWQSSTPQPPSTVHFFFCAVSSSEALGAQPNAFYVAVMICSSVTASVTSSLRQLPFRLRRFVLVPRLATSWKAAHPKGQRVASALRIPYVRGPGKEFIIDQV